MLVKCWGALRASRVLDALSQLTFSLINSLHLLSQVKYMVDVLGFDAGINYKTEDVADALRKATPKGVDAYVPP